MSAPAGSLHTTPPGFESLAMALLDGLAAARGRRSVQRLRPAATPKPNCHDAVDVWVATHPGAQAVRGWRALELDDTTTHFYAHSLVRGADGTVFEVTLSEHDAALPFVPHPVTAEGFFSLLCRPGAPYELQVCTRNGEASP